MTQSTQTEEAWGPGSGAGAPAGSGGSSSASRALPSWATSSMEAGVQCDLGGAGSGSSSAGGGGGPAQQHGALKASPAPPVPASHRVSFDATAAGGPGWARQSVDMSGAAGWAGGGSSSGGTWREVLEALREHAGDIAHDMKNPLNGVLALSQNVLQVRHADAQGCWCTGVC